ncbi:helix-turn-helix transcriptional regulator [Pontibacter sp. FD36]|uniref:helix-turn-helix domain-containing protein n=1 Tax=Pontibacter sp. FD36 TaxID=2789860 RepID=UPI0018AC04CD|nr:helix-turn-helix transcriptional regulator [Pontibacter sp. FD36]MBF8964049.1 helix-turn-helix transcriptional regulator [Pontibacter sp. FD36]
METAARKRPIHLGEHVRRMRTALGIKQASLASELGTTQQNISRIEQEEDMDMVTLEKVAKALGVTPEAIVNFTPEDAIYNIQNNYEGANSGSGTLSQKLDYHQCTFNPIEKVVELYDALLKAEREKNELLERMLKSQRFEN